MTQPFLLQIVERLESFLGKLPATIQKPVLNELTPLKELFLRQRSPRFVFTGSAKPAIQELLPLLFGGENEAHRDVLMELFHWQNVSIGGHGSIEILDARGADSGAIAQLEAELQRRPADVFLHIVHGGGTAGAVRAGIDEMGALHARTIGAPHPAKIIGVTVDAGDRAGRSSRSSAVDGLMAALQPVPAIRDHVLRIFAVQRDDSAEARQSVAREFLALLARELPHDVKVEIVRISRDRASQAEIAQLLIKSTAAVCAAIGTQPIPLADLPILTALQLVMVSGIMYISGRERNVRAATEFVAALGVNVGAGMVLREGARAALKFFPGWGNVVCGMVAGAGTYAIGKAAAVYFIEGVSLQDARKMYATLRNRRTGARFLPSGEGRRPRRGRPAAIRNEGADAPSA